MKRKKNNKYPYGGKAKGGVEIENNELVESPSGEQKIYKGETHKQGGIDLELTHQLADLTAKFNT